MKKQIIRIFIPAILILCLAGCTVLVSRQLWRNWRAIDFERRYYLENKVSIELPAFRDAYSSNKDEYEGWIYTKWKGPGMGDIPVSEIIANGGAYKRQKEDGVEGAVYDVREESILYVEKNYKRQPYDIKGFSYQRYAFIILGNKYFEFFCNTDASDYMLPDVEEKKLRIKEDDKIFTHLLDSFRQNKDGKWIKPKVIWKGPKEFEYVEDK